MILKKLSFFILIISVFTVSENAVERKKPLLLKELQNCMPIPYPQTDAEVLTDLKYYMQSIVRDIFQENTSGDRSSIGDFERICLNFLGNQGISVGEIVKVNNKMASRERDYAFLIRLKNENNYGVASIGMDANGIIFTSSYIDLINLSKDGPHLQKMIFEPIADKSEVKMQIKKAIGYDLDAEEENNMILVEGLSLVGDTLCPAWEVKLKSGRILYKSHKLNAIYEIVETLDTYPNTKDHKAKNAAIMRNSGDMCQNFDQSAIGKELVLREVYKEK